MIQIYKNTIDKFVIEFQKEKPIKSFGCYWSIMILINEIHLVSIEVILFISFINSYHENYE